nr:putative reverse transcriptase domain-containing protein [Tanacetum cinerariifolium]
MPPRRSEGEELEYPFFEGDSSSFDEWIGYGVAGNDYEGPPIFDDDQFEDELEMGDDAFVLIGKKVAPNSEILEAMFPLLEEFSDVFHDELLDALPSLCDIQHHIDLEPSSQLRNRPNYRLCPREHEELRRQVEEFVSNGHIRKIMSTCAHPRGPLDLMSLLVSGSVPKKVQNFVEGLPYHGDSSDDDLVGNSRTNFVYPWGNDEGPSIEERSLLFLEAQDRVKEKAKKFRDA